MTPRTVAFATYEAANHAAAALALWGIATRTTGTAARWEVTIVELPAQLTDATRAVAETTDPRYTELDEHDYGRSTMWDDRAERDLTGEPDHRGGWRGY